MVAGHTEDPFGYHQDTASCLITERLGSVELLDEGLHIVVLEYETLALVQTNAVHHAGVRLRIVDNHVVSADQCFDGRLASLVAVVQKERVLFLHEISQLRLKQLVLSGLA